MPTADANKLINWDSRYSVGIGQMDAEHQKLIALINELHAERKAGRTDATGRILDGLVRYTISHFSAEEALMKKTNYPGYDEQVKEHEGFTARVKKMQADFHAGKPVDVEVMTALQQWLIGHILGKDKRYTRHLQEAGIK